MVSFPKIRFCTTWLVKILFQTKSFGIENIPESSPFVVVANHASFLDPYFIGYTCIHREVGFMAKEELFRIPLFGHFIRACGAFPVKRGSRDETAVQNFHDYLHSGKPLVVFPEGTRTPNGELQPAKKGVGKLLYIAQVPVIPAYIAGTFECWPKGRAFPKPGKTSVTYGAPIELGDLYQENAEKVTYVRIAGRIMEKIAQLRPKESI